MKLVAAERFTIGPLAHPLKNRFYVSEFTYRGEIHKGQHEAIVGRYVFDAAQAQLAERTVKRKLPWHASVSAILTRLLFDDRGHPMSPSQTSSRTVGDRAIGRRIEIVDLGHAPPEMGVGDDHARVGRERRAAHESLLHASRNHGLEHMPQQIALAEAAMSILRERGMVGNLAVEPQWARHCERGARDNAARRLLLRHSFRTPAV